MDGYTFGFTRNIFNRISFWQTTLDKPQISGSFSSLERCNRRSSSAVLILTESESGDHTNPLIRPKYSLVMHGIIIPIENRHRYDAKKITDTKNINEAININTTRKLLLQVSLSNLLQKLVASTRSCRETALVKLFNRCLTITKVHS